MASQIVGVEKVPGGIKVTRGDDALIITESYRYLVYSDDINATRQEIAFFTPGLPIVGILYSQNGLICSSVDAQRRADHGNYWDVTCDFESGRENQRQSSGNPTSPDPTTWIPVFRVDSFETKTRVLTKDKADPEKLILNGAGQKFETPLTEDVTLCCWGFTQFEDVSLTLDDIMNRNNKTNDAAVSGAGLGTFAENTLKLNVQKAEQGFYAGYAAWRIEYKVTYDPDTWETKLLNVGSLYKDVDGDWVPFMDKTNTYRIYGNLNSDGTAQDPLGDPEEIAFQTYEKISFSFIRTA